MSLDQCRSKLPLPELWQRLGCAGQFPAASRKAPVPWRADEHPSFSASHSDGRWRWNDWARGDKGDEVDFIKQLKGCDTKEAIRLYHELAGVAHDSPQASRPQRARKPRLSAAANTPADVVSTPPPPAAAARVVNVYSYVDRTGIVQHQTLRYEPKGFRQRRPVRDGEVLPDGLHADSDGYVWTLAGAKLVPYRLPDLIRADANAPVFLCEGEKDADALAELGLAATTLPMGSHKWRPEYAQYFANRWVVVVEDFDKEDSRGQRAGEIGALKVAQALVPVAERVGLVRMPELAPNVVAPYDLSDWLAWATEHHKPAGIRRHLLAHAARHDAPAHLYYSGVLEASQEGEAKKVLQSELAGRLVKRERLMWSGGIWWTYALDGDGCGCWVQCRTPDVVGRAVEQAVVAAGGSRLVTDSVVRSVEALAARRVSRSPDELNQTAPLSINVRNGMLDMLTGRLEPHRPDMLSTVRVPHRWNPDAECTLFDAWLRQMQPSAGVRSMLQEIAGYVLCSGINFHSFFFFYGDGSTGKSTFVEVLEALVGKANTVAVQLQELDKPFIRHQLVGRQLYLCKELTKDSFKHIGLIKAITSGDPVFCDVKNRAGFTFRPCGRFVMESNVVAHTPDTSGGFERRFLQVDWRVVVPLEDRDYGLVQKLVAESDGILRWAVEGFQRLHARGRFCPTDESQEATAELLRHRDQVGSWARDNWVVPGPSDKYVLTIDLYQSWRAWCDEHDVKPYTDEANVFAREVSRKRPEWRKDCRREAGHDGTRERRWYGLRLSETCIEAING